MEVVRCDGTRIDGDVMFFVKATAALEIAIQSFRDIEDEASGDVGSGAWWNGNSIRKE